MNQLQALHDTVALAESRNMPEIPGNPLGLGHLRQMLRDIGAAEESMPFSAAKLGRWLGWAQCALVAANVGVSLDDLRELNSELS